MTDQPGRFQSPGGTTTKHTPHQSGDPENDFRHQSAERFAMEVVGYLETARQKGRFDRLVVVAAPLFLGVLRDKLTASLAQMVTHEINKDYTHLTPIELGRRLLVNSR